MIRAVRFTAVALAGLTLTACQNNIGTTSSATPSGTSTSRNSSGLLTTRTAITAIEGREYTTLYTVDPRGKADARVGVLALGDDGTTVIASYPPPPPADVLIQSQVGIQTGQSRKWFPIQNSSRPGAASGAAIHGQSIAWLDTTLAMRPSVDVNVFAVRAGYRQPIRLSDSRDLVKSEVIPILPNGNLITTDGSHVWWIRTYPTKKPRGWGARIMVRDLAAHEPVTTAVDGAKNPIATPSGLVYVRSSDVDSKMPTNRYEIRLHQVGTDTLIASGALVKGEQVSTMCASDTVLAWAVRSPVAPSDDRGAAIGGRLHVILRATKSQQIIQLDDSAWGLDLGCGKAFVAWGSGSSYKDPAQYVFDVPSSTLWKLGKPQGISLVLASGSMLAWPLEFQSSKTTRWRITRWHGK